MEFIYIATLIVIIIIGTLVYPCWKDNRAYFGLLIVSFGLSLLYIIHNRDTVIEHLQISGEAVQNVGSIYNQNKMIIKDLEVTGQLTVKDVTADTIHAKTNLTVEGSINSNKQIIADSGFKTGQWYIEPVGSAKNRLRFIYDDRNGLSTERPFVKGLRPFTIDPDTRIYDKWSQMYDYDEEKETNSKGMMYAYGQRESK